MPQMQASDISMKDIATRFEQNRLGERNYTINDTFTMAHALTIAAEKFEANAVEFEKIKADMPLITASAARSLAIQFRLQAKEARLMSRLVSAGDKVLVTGIENDEDLED